MPLDLSKDYLILDGLENVTLDGNPITGAYRGDIEEVEGSPTEGIYLQTDVDWQIPTPPAIVPRIGQTIVDAAGRTYNILAIRKPFLGDYYGCSCRLSTIESDLPLSNKLTLYPAITGVAGDGSRIVDNSVADPAFLNIPCRIQRMEGDVQDFMGKRGLDRLYHIFVARDVDLHYGDIVKDDTAIQYTVQSWENRERIDELSLIVCHIME